MPFGKYLFPISNASSSLLYRRKIVIFTEVVQDTRITKPSLPGSRTGSRRGSRGSSGNASAVSSRSNKSPPNQTTPADPVMEDVTVEILEAKA